ncbi:NAD synthetase / Glutamine amidotransferase chain of NAD synthetase [hydrothermal vent metagenome]|uniref:NAD(+) synthase (glutamine-hydrolyzing) n=1 Tax=hydrothermal vent metagenome TaxID=652676 RepID=A0A3B1C6X9_9ZZZZ
MTSPLRLALAQVNPTVGDLKGNTDIILSCIDKAKAQGADLVVFPELCITGYPPEDLLIRKAFIKKTGEAVDEIASSADGLTVIVGAPVFDGGLRNAALILADGKWLGSIYKKELPNYGVFDEKRYFTPGDNGPLVKIGEHVVGVTICEDIWVANDIVRRQVEDGAGLLVNIAGSPYRVDAGRVRGEIAAALAKKHNVPFAYVNIVGGQDELVFDGRSFLMGKGAIALETLAAFEEDILVVDVNARGSGPGDARMVIKAAQSGEPKPATRKRKPHSIENENEEIYKAITLGTRDYVNKNGFKGALIALSGGIDSALVLALAVDALGPRRVHALSMPSPYSSQGSIEDARKLADNLGVKMESIPIDGLIAQYDKALSHALRGRDKDTTEENIQARIRGALIMALSNKFGCLVLATGNKSELATGYCTLYGDMAGGFAVIKDLFKTKVYDLCRWRNKQAGYDIIPKEIIEKEPSAELKPDQKDTDSLPAYETLDPILKAYIERGNDVDEIVEMGYSGDLVLEVMEMVDRNEYKRRQGPVGVKITVRAFGRDWRLPITNQFKRG